MIIDMSVIWRNGPTRGTIQTDNARLVGGSVFQGTGRMNNWQYEFDSTGLCQITLQLDTGSEDTTETTAKLIVNDEATPCTIQVSEVLEKASLDLGDGSMSCTAERNRWAEL